MILDRAIGIFVERVPAAPRARLAAARQLVVVDACSRRHCAGAMLRHLESLVPVESRLVDFSGLASEPGAAQVDQVWLLVDQGSDLPYCDLLREELETRCSAPATIVAVGDIEMAAPARFEPAHLGLCPPWRRRRGLLDGARHAARLIADHPRVAP